MNTIWLNILVGRAISSATPVNALFNASYAMQSFSKEPISDVMQNKNINWTRSESPIWIKMLTTRTSILITKIYFQIFSAYCTRGGNMTSINSQTSYLFQLRQQWSFCSIHASVPFFNSIATLISHFEYFDLYSI